MNHQGEFLVTGLQRQVLIEWLRIIKHALNLTKGVQIRVHTIDYRGAVSAPFFLSEWFIFQSVLLSVCDLSLNKDCVYFVCRAKQVARQHFDGFMFSLGIFSQQSHAGLMPPRKTILKSNIEHYHSIPYSIIYANILTSLLYKGV